MVAARPSSEHVSQRLAIEQLGDQVGSRAVGPDVVHRQNVGMIEPAGRCGLQREAAQALSIGRVQRRVGPLRLRRD